MWNFIRLNEFRLFMKESKSWKLNQKETKRWWRVRYCWNDAIVFAVISGLDVHFFSVSAFFFSYTLFQRRRAAISVFIRFHARIPPKPSSLILLTFSGNSLLLKEEKFWGKEHECEWNYNEDELSSPSLTLELCYPSIPMTKDNHVLPSSLLIPFFFLPIGYNGWVDGVGVHFGIHVWPHDSSFIYTGYDGDTCV